MSPFQFENIEKKCLQTNKQQSKQTKAYKQTHAYTQPHTHTHTHRERER